jgi:uncharacterized protein
MDRISRYFSVTMSKSISDLKALLPLRRLDSAEENPAAIEDFLRAATFGFLATRSENEFPNIVPLNFVWTNGAVYFHSARIGQKIKDLKHENRVTFCVAEEAALIPSYFMDEKLACPATAFFKSVIVYGVASFVDEDAEKVAALSAFMEKLQPEGGYSPFDISDPEYRRNIRSVAVTKITPTALTAKFKFGQNRGEEDWLRTRDGLRARGRSGDAEAVAEMEKRCPFGHL